MKTFNFGPKYQEPYGLKTAGHQLSAKRRRYLGFFMFTIISILALSAVAGCKAAEEELPTIKPWQENTSSIEGLKSKAENIAVAEGEPDADGVELKGVGFAADGSYVIVSFIAPPVVAQNWWEDSIYVIDEKTGVVYKEIPVMPKIGPLIGKPQEAGQIGYVMLINHSFGVQPGSVVTVVLGNYKRVHVQIQ